MLFIYYYILSGNSGNVHNIAFHILLPIVRQVPDCILGMSAGFCGQQMAQYFL